MEGQNVQDFLKEIADEETEVEDIRPERRKRKRAIPQDLYERLIRKALHNNHRTLDSIYTFIEDNHYKYIETQADWKEKIKSELEMNSRFKQADCLWSIKRKSQSIYKEKINLVKRFVDCTFDDYQRKKENESTVGSRNQSGKASTDPKCFIHHTFVQGKNPRKQSAEYNKQCIEYNLQNVKFTKQQDEFITTVFEGKIAKACEDSKENVPNNALYPIVFTDKETWDQFLEYQRYRKYYDAKLKETVSIDPESFGPGCSSEYSGYLPQESNVYVPFYKSENADAEAYDHLSLLPDADMDPISMDDSMHVSPSINEPLSSHKDFLDFINYEHHE